MVVTLREKGEHINFGMAPFFVGIKPYDIFVCIIMSVRPICIQTGQNS